MKKLRNPLSKPLFRALLGALMVGLVLSKALNLSPSQPPLASPPLTQADAPSPQESAQNFSAISSPQGASTGPRSKSAANPAVDAPPPLPGSCTTIEYQHQVTMKTRDIEDFLDFSNAFPIDLVALNPKSICVKVDGRPVEFQLSHHGGKKEIVVGPVVGPESVIRVSYCSTDARCTEACAKPKKRFMDDLLDDAHADEFQDSWGKNSHDADSRELRNKARELETLAHEHGSLADHAMMRDWNTLSRQARTCKKD